ncbi:MAG: TetR/AcrR family transcriptional regulator [Clostridia bacterium]|nr:TetR/AcrR family transcriptional regulator [Clostridia bacterium]
MATKDHSLDEGIVKAAYSEFLEHGFQKASIHKIAEKAGVTTGAIYTRYKSKDALFVSLLQPFFAVYQSFFAPAAAEYEKARGSRNVEALCSAIRFEEELYVRLLTEHYDDCTLFFCKSDGSSIEAMRKDTMEAKARTTVQFFRDVYGKDVNALAIRLLMGSQFWYFRQLLDERLTQKDMLESLRSVLEFSNAGWKQFYETLIS